MASNLTVVPRPLAVAALLDGFSRQTIGGNDDAVIVGALLGKALRGSVEVTDAFVVKCNFTANEVVMDKEYHRKMLAAKRKITPSEGLVGWFCTASSLGEWAIPLQSFFGHQESGFAPSVFLQHPVVLMANPMNFPSEFSIGLKAFTAPTLPENLHHFKQVSLYERKGAEDGGAEGSVKLVYIQIPSFHISISEQSSSSHGWACVSSFLLSSVEGFKAGSKAGDVCSVEGQKRIVEEHMKKEKDAHVKGKMQEALKKAQARKVHVDNGLVSVLCGIAKDEGSHNIQDLIHKAQATLKN